jgi:hypothetical protein
MPKKTRVGRPPSDNPRCSAINVRITEEEKSAIEAHLDWLNNQREAVDKPVLRISDWARARLLSEVVA